MPDAGKADTRRRLTWRAGGFTVAVGLLTMAFLVEPSAPQAREPARPVPITVKAQPLDGFDVRDASRRRFGQLMFRGGLVLSSSYDLFGGLSALHVEADGARFVALSDKGYWLSGRITYRGAVPSGIADARMMPVLGADGRALLTRGWYDTESLAIDGGTAYVGIERVNQIVRFDFGKDGILARGTPIEVPPALRKLPLNKGIEGLVAVPKGAPDNGGALIAFSERGLDPNGNLVAFLIGGPQPGTFAVKRSLDYDISDAALLPPGEVLILERKWSLLAGVHIRIRRVPLAAIKPGALVDGKTIFEADLGYQIDNLEGLSVHRDVSGETVLTLVSDDNYSPIQRTLLLQFTLVEE